jgi:hypothetical protein
MFIYVNLAMFNLNNNFKYKLDVFNHTLNNLRYVPYLCQFSHI